jgi:phospholipase C
MSALLTLIAPACSPSHLLSGGGGALLPGQVKEGRSASTPIDHIIIVVQENRSFDNIFAGYPGADTATAGRTHDGSMVALRAVSFKSLDTLSGAYQLRDGIADWDSGKMDGFDLPTNQTGSAVGRFPYAYLQRSLVKPYWEMAGQYVLADHMFPTQWGPSYTAHLDLIAGSTLLSAGEADADTPTAFPWGCDAPAGTTTETWSSTGAYGTSGPFPCFDDSNSLFGPNTLANVLDSAGISWRYYAPALSTLAGSTWSAFDSVRNVRYGADWQNVVSPETTILTDAEKSLPRVSWVIPDFKNSDHSGSQSNTGPSWVAAVVNAVGRSKYWKSSVIIVLWDDWGGWYDNAPPPQPDFAGLGIRVPCIIISPYARRHYVSHTQYEFGSVLKFVEQTFGLPSLGTTDARASSLVDALDFTQPPRKFTPFSSAYSAANFLREKPSHKPPDDM